MTSLTRRSIHKGEDRSTPSTKTFVPSPRRNTPREDTSDSSKGEADDLSEEDDVDSDLHSTPPRVYPCLKKITEETAKLETPLLKSSLKPESKEVPNSVPELRRKSNATSLCYILGCLFAVLLAAFYVVPYYRSSITQPTGDNPSIFPTMNYTMLRDDMTVSLKKMRKEFPSSEVHLWKSAWACLYSILRDTPPQPGVLLLAPATEQALPTFRCLARKLALVTSDLLQRMTGAEIDNEWAVNAAAFQDNTNAASFMELLKRRLARGLLLIQDVDLLPAKLAMTLHGLCDNENAPYKQSVVILLLSQPPPMGGHGLQDSFDRYLSKIWTQSGELNLDSVSSLVSRISNYAASVGAEPRQSC